MNIFDNIAFGLRNNVYSNVYDIGTMNLMNEYGFDEEEVDALQRKLSRIEKPKDVKAYVISTFKHDSPYYQFSEIITSLDKERHFKTYSEAKNDVLAILKNLNVDIALNIEDSCKYNAAKKEILSLIAKEDKYYKMISTIEDRKFKEDVIRGEVIKALKFVNLEGYENREISSLSGGQMQRVAVARTLVLNPDIILFDEPTSGLDYHHMVQVSELLKQLQQNGKTVLIVTHDIELIKKVCTRVVIFGT
jgi:ABC-type sugar transport system ATPase subunit